MAVAVEMDCVGLKALLVGQVLSLLLTCINWSSSMLARNGFHAPITQAFLMYGFSAVVYGAVLVYRRRRVHLPWHWYLGLAVVDVEATYLGLLAYRYTSITSVTLLYCTSIPCVLFLSWYFLRTRYGPNHFLGVAICVAGIVVAVLSDVHSSDRHATTTTTGTKILLGDALVVAAAMLCSSVIVSTEFVVKKVDQVEYLALFSFFGAVISGCQLTVMELEELGRVDWSFDTLALTMGFVGSTVAFISLGPWLLRLNGATMLNLSLLTSNMWAVVIQALGFHEAVHGLYFVALGLVAVGLLLYSSAGEPSHAAAKEASLESAPELKYTLIDPVEKESDVV